MATCPRCGGTLELVRDGAIGKTYHPGYHVLGTALPIRHEPLPFRACSGCEFCEQIIRQIPPFPC